HMSFKQLKAMLNALPVEITLVDEEDINIYFNEGEKVFTRPQVALGRPVYSCHPKRVEPIVRMLISDFKKGKRDSLTILSERSGHPVVISYFALREDGKYLGTLEAVQIIDGLVDAIKNDKKGPIDLK
ncbi:MAG: PAS domain-containing protein, partial [Solobacterium sp.]|nr:PAS domain-containing protein [Solobacterium sp.]